MKKCKDCGATKPLDQFHRNKKMADGRLNSCKDCRCDEARQYYRENREDVKRRVREYRRERVENDPDWRERERARSRRKWQERGHLWGTTRRDAHREVDKAVRRGDLIPAEECEDCGHDFFEFRREAHHPDYDKPLRVHWLCSLCHGKRHRITESEAA